jgi:hypothetical protein
MPAKTLIVCRDQKQLREAKLAFGPDFARYETIGSSLCGARFSRIIVVCGDPRSRVEAGEQERFIREDLPTKLVARGELYVL